MGQGCYAGVAKSAKELKEPNEKTQLTTQASEILKEQVDDVKEEGIKGYLGSFICCVEVAKIDFPILEEHRHAVLWISHILCMIAIVFSFLAFWGGFAHTATVKWLPWVALDGPLGEAFAGVKWLCWDLPYPPQDGTFGDSVSGVVKTEKGEFWQCKLWSSFDCNVVPAPHACSVCKIHATGFMVSIFMAVFSFIALLQATNKRLGGEDSNWVKFSAVLSCLVGGTSFLVSVSAWWYSCMFSAHSQGFSIKRGIGLYFILAATVFKVVMAFVHLGLPVEKYEAKVDKKLDA